MAKKTKPTEAQAEPVIEASTLIGDLVHWVRDEMIALPSVWQSLSEAGQRIVLDRLAKRAESIAAETIDILSAQNMPALTAELASVQFKGGIKAQLTFRGDDPNRFLLADAVNKRVRVLILPGMEEFGGGMPEAEPDQGSLLDGSDEE